MEEKKKRTKKSIIIFALILAGVLVLGIVGKLAGLGGGSDEDISGAASVHGDFVGVLYIEGTISESDTQYDHDYALDAINGMIENKDNKGLMLYINTPGGGVYESDELYLKIKEYQEDTGRPVYAYLGNQATSGGYYVAAPADRILANRNCWTGSIGVTLGNLYDISGLLTKYGIKSTTITSGANKAMGDMTAPMTEEQRKIFQSLVDEAYDQFVAIVAEGRLLDESYVRGIADGRIYTAKQAKELKLVDGVVDTYDDAIDDMVENFGLDNCDIKEFRYEPDLGVLNSFIQSINKLADASAGNGDIKALTELMEQENEMPLQYMCEVTK